MAYVKVKPIRYSVVPVLTFIRNSRIFSTHMDRKYIDEFEKYKAYPCIAQ